MSKELWRRVKDVGETYEISSFGRLRNWGGRGMKYIKETIPCEGKRPFYQFMVNGTHYCILTEWVVARTFIPNPHNLPCVCHKDGDILNNNVDNLYWGDTLEEIPSLKGEVWKDVVGYEGLYKVSNKGRVISLARFSFNRMIRGRVLRPGSNQHGYEIVSLAKDGKNRGFLVHRLVAMAFIPNPLNKPSVDHIDTNKRNNCVDNLRWCTNEENMKNTTTSAKMKSHGGAQSKRAIPILRVSLYDGSIKTYGFLKEAIKDNHISHQHLNKCLTGKLFSHKGYRWFYLNNLKIKEE